MHCAIFLSFWTDALTGRSDFTEGGICGSAPPGTHYHHRPTTCDHHSYHDLRPFIRQCETGVLFSPLHPLMAPRLLDVLLGLRLSFIALYKGVYRHFLDSSCIHHFMLRLYFILYFFEVYSIVYILLLLIALLHEDY